VDGSEKASRMMTRFDVCDKQDWVYQYQVGLLVHNLRICSRTGYISIRWDC